MGLFIVFEGGEGSGKSTQSKTLARRLTEAGRQTMLTYEPGGTPTGERIRRWLKDSDSIDPMTELFLFSAARSALVHSVIRPALERGESVVCDRYIYSTIAYQGYGRGLGSELVDGPIQLSTGGLVPDLIVLLDLPATEGITKRKGTRLDRIEREKSEFHERVRAGYLELAGQDPERWLVLNGCESKATLSDQVWNRVTEITSGGRQ